MPDAGQAKLDQCCQAKNNTPTVNYFTFSNFLEAPIINPAVTTCFEPTVEPCHLSRTPGTAHFGLPGITILFLGSALFLISFSMPRLLFQGPFLMLTITISFSWDPSHSPCTLSNPYAVPNIIARQGILFAYLFLVMDNYSSSQFSHIGCILLLLILLSMIFHDILFLLSGTFYLVPPCSFAYSADLFWSI